MHKMDVSSKWKYISNMYLMKDCVGRSKEIDKPYGRMILLYREKRPDLKLQNHECTEIQYKHNKESESVQMSLLLYCAIMGKATNENTDTME